MRDNPFVHLSNTDLEQNLLTLAKTERDANADIIMQLALVKERRLYVPAGYDSLFSYCVGKLGFSRSTAYRRKAVVDKVGEFPELVERLRAGRLHLCAAAALAPHLEKDSAGELLDAVDGMSHREVETHLIKRSAAMRASTATFVSPCLDVETGFALGTKPTASGINAPALVTSALSPPPPRQRTVIRPVDAETSRFSATLSDETLARLQRAKEILGGKSDDEILSRALNRLLDEIAPERRHARRLKRQSKKETPKATKPAKTTPSPSTLRRGRLADRDRVMTEGDARCSYVAKDGTRCRARTFLQIDHAVPYALGGSSRRGNLDPMCATHNLHRARETFGDLRGDHRGAHRLSS